MAATAWCLLSMNYERSSAFSNGSIPSPSSCSSVLRLEKNKRSSKEAVFSIKPSLLALNARVKLIREQLAWPLRRWPNQDSLSSLEKGPSLKSEDGLQLAISKTAFVTLTDWSFASYRCSSLIQGLVGSSSRRDWSCCTFRIAWVSSALFVRSAYLIY